MGAMKILFPPRPHAAHIAIVMHDFSTGGSERIAIRLANQWVAAGRRVSILCGVSEGPARALVDPRVTIVGVWPAIARSVFSRFALGGALADCVTALQPDIIFSPGNFHLPVIGIMARILRDARPAIVCKLSNPLRRRDRPDILQMIFGAITRLLVAPVDAFVAMSSSLADEARHILQRQNVQRIYEPNIEIAEQRRSRAPAAPDGPDGPLIVCAGRLVRQKNFTLAIEAFAQLDPALDARLLILGEGEERIRLEVLVDRLGLNEKVRFAGHVRDIRPSLARASLFLLSSRYEGYPAVLIEALAAGVPVVTTQCSPALAEVMTCPAFGRIVPDNAADMAAAIDDLLHTRRHEHIDASALLDRHRIDHVADEYLDLFDRVVEARQSTRITDAITHPTAIPSHGWKAEAPGV